LKTRRILEAQSSLALVRDGKTEPLTLGEDANLSVRSEPAPSLDAPLVFVGYGLNVPERQINDFEGLSMRGAVAVYIAATPAALPGPLQAHFGSAGGRWKMDRAAGAVGAISSANPQRRGISWARSALARLRPQMGRSDASLGYTA